MKKCIISVIIGCCAVLTAWASDGVVNLGQVPFQQAVTATFELTNSSAEPMIITRVDASCSCTVVDYPEGLIAPGASFTIRATYDAQLMGHFVKFVEVYTTAGDFDLELRGVVVAEVDELIDSYPFELGELLADCNAIEFEDLRKGEVRTQRFHVYNPTTESVSPQVLHLPPYLTAEVTPTTIRPNRAAEVVVTLNSALCRNYGYENTSIYLGANLGERIAWNKRIDLSFTLLPAEVELTAAQKIYMPKAVLSEENLALPVADGKNRSGVVLLQNVGRSDLEIYSMELPCEGLQATLSKRVIAPGETVKLKIKTDAKALKYTVVKPRISLVTNDPDKPKINIDVDIF